MNRSMKLLRALNDIDDKFLIKEYQVVSRKNIFERIFENINKRKLEYVLSPVLVLAIVLASMVTSKESNNLEQKLIPYDNSLNSNGTQIQISVNDINKDSQDEKIKGITLTETYQEINLNLDDFVEKSLEELQEYYRTKIIPKEIDNLKLNSHKKYGYYFNENRNIYYDQNYIEYENIDTNQKFSIVVSKNRKIHYDYDFREYKTSIINQREITILHFVDENNSECYYTNFEKDGVYFDITSYNLNVDIFVEEVESLL